MFDALKRYLDARRRRPNWRGLSAWARTAGHTLKRVREGDGLAIEGQTDGTPWRLEWGPSQRAYIEGAELRLRVEAGLPGDLQLLVLTRELAERLERETFEQFTQTTRTYDDSSAPEEVRWLAMYTRVRLPKMLRGVYAAVGMEEEAALAWLDPTLSAQLLGQTGALRAGARPLALIALRGRIYVRVGTARVTPAMLDEVCALADVAVRQARALVRVRIETGAWASVAPSAWAAASSRAPLGR